MRLMDLLISDEIVASAEHLPLGAMLVVHEVSWDEYEVVLEGLQHRRTLRISYDSGRLEIVSVSSGHGWYQSLIGDLVVIFCEVFRFRSEKLGPVTWKRRSLLKGTEPDVSLYVRNRQQIIGKDIDIETDPPPDIVVEVDITRDSTSRFPILAALGVQEVWQYDGKSCRFYALAKGKYEGVPVSQLLPHLTGEMIADAVEISKTKGQDEARKTFRRRMKALKKTL
jgi:Uma2 family endonuclease